MDLRDRNVLVVGCGKSGIGAALYLQKKAANVWLYDDNEKLTQEDVLQKLPADFPVEIFLKELPEEKKQQVEIVVLSPGVPVDIPFVEQFKEMNIPIWGEIELAYTSEKGRVVAITGTNGKTTTTTLVGEIMARYFAKSFVMGNIGYPYTDMVDETTSESVTVGEISSFQLETIDTFHPTVSAVLNITPDHLNRHHTMDNYIAAKAAITKNQTKDDVCVLNYENEDTRKIGEHCNASVFYFSSQRELEEGIYLKGEEICLAKDGKRQMLMNIQDMNLVGICNVENVMAAIAIAMFMDVPMDVILDTVKAFRAVEHRIEYVDTVNGVDYYNDSKGTNPDAAIQGIKAMIKKTVLIGGGYDKESSYDEWIEAFDGKVKLFVLIGQTREKIAECARAHGFMDIVFADTFEEAFRICVENAEDGEAVLLSPACASWGMFPNYEVRGQMFKDMVNALKSK
ncbi:MAG: UDP-N-acetylmuramoyl-L-alanine--D-glutamate ligase [Lachnospiraceae bacterium]|nr:UDP-N-acetylmuramoyl-L-alanine--D-glutamate ligase [Lachnospiraceae bacterium]